MMKKFFIVFASLLMLGSYISISAPIYAETQTELEQRITNDKK